MGFPVPLSDWMRRARPQLRCRLVSRAGSPLSRPGFDVATLVEREAGFARNLWGLLSLELWQQAFHDRGSTGENSAHD